MEIVWAVPADTDAVAEYDVHLSRARLEKCVGEGALLLLKDGPRVAGILRYSLFWQTIPFVDLIFLGEAYRGQGHGTRLLRFFECAMRDRGYTAVLTSTQADETAFRFYEKCGYDKCGGFFPPEQDTEEWIYRKFLL